MKTRAVFFDLGGTLLVMRRDRIFQMVLEEEGMHVGLETVHSAYLRAEPWWLATYGIRKMTGEETNDAYRALDARVFEAVFPAAAQSESERVSRVIRGRWPELQLKVPPELYPDAEPLLARLREDGYVMALVSNAPPDTQGVVEALGLEEYLGTIVISGIVGFTKPNPEIFRIALGRAGVLPEETIHVGDLYDSDVVGATNAGIKGVLLDREGTQGPFLCPTIRTLDEVYGLLG